MKAQYFWQTALWAAVLSLAAPLWADSISSNLLPSDGNVSGPPGSTVGWGYSFTNDSVSDWFVTTDLSSDSFSNGTPTSLFDFPDLGPGGMVTESFDPVNGVGLFGLVWDLSAPAGFVNSGNFVLSGEWWTGDPANGGQFIANAPDTALSYTARVSASTTTTPEPSSFVLLACGIAAIIGLRTQGKLPSPKRE